MEGAILLIVVTRAIGFVFGYAVLIKIWNWASLCNGVRAYNLLPESTVPIAASALILTEGTVAVTHLALIAMPAATLLTMCLLLGFLVFVVLSISGGESRSCLCFGVNEEEKLSGHTVARIALLLVCEGIVFASIFFFEIYPDADLIANLADEVASLVAAVIVVMHAAFFLSIPWLYVWWRVRPTAKDDQLQLRSGMDPIAIALVSRPQRRRWLEAKVSQETVM